MSSQRQPKLPGTSTRRQVGTIEKYAGADLRALDDLGMLPPASESIRAAYRAVARQLDDAVRSAKTWDVISSTKELRSIRAQLLAEGGHVVNDDELERFLASLPATPRGYTTEP